MKQKVLKGNTHGGTVPLQSLVFYITSLSSRSIDREWIQQEPIMYLDWAILRWCFSLLCLMGALGLLGLVGQMGSQVPGPIWVLNGLSPVCLPSWFGSRVTWPLLSALPWLRSPGSSHQVCFNLTVHGKHYTSRYFPSLWPNKAAVHPSLVCTLQALLSYLCWCFFGGILSVRLFWGHTLDQV